MLPSPFHCPGADFARVISQKFERGRFLVVGADPAKLQGQFAEIGREAVVIESGAELAAKRSQEAAAIRFEIALWFYSSEKSDDDRMVEELSRCADEIVLIPGAGLDVAERRPQLVEKFGRFKLLPDYECDLGEIHPGALSPAPAAGRNCRRLGSRDGNGFRERKRTPERAGASAP